MNILKNNIYNMDVFTFLDSLKNDSIDLAIVDPPYNLKKADWDSFKTENDFFEFTFKWIKKLLPKIKEKGSIYIFNTPENSAKILTWMNNLEKIYFKNWITWFKKDGFSYSKKKYISNQETILFFTKSKNEFTFNYDLIRVPYESTERINHAKVKGILKNGKRWFPNTKGKLCSDVWNFSSDRHNKKIKGKIIKSIHPTPKPEKLIERIIKASSNENDLILDLFAGTGTTSLLSKKLNREYVGCEINDVYYEFALNRLSEMDINNENTESNI